LLSELGLEGTLQIASFHPDYCFADSEPDDAANYSNRSPFPMLHLLREASVSRARRCVSRHRQHLRAQHRDATRAHAGRGSAACCAMATRSKQRQGLAL